MRAVEDGRDEALKILSKYLLINQRDHQLPFPAQLLEFHSQFMLIAGE